MTKPRIGWIGIGNMGAPLCRNLLRAGFAVATYDVDPARAVALAADGAQAQPTIAALVGISDLIFSTVPDDRALRALVTAPSGLVDHLAAHQTYVDMSTVSPEVSAEVAVPLSRSGAAYLRAPVSGSTASAAAGSLTIFCSGSRATFDAVTPVLKYLGSRLIHAGAGEEARVLKLIVNMIVAATPALLGEALAVGARAGLDWAGMIDAIADSAAGSPVVKYKVDMMKGRDWTAAATIDLVSKDLDLALGLGRSLGLDLPLASLVRDLNRARQTAGQGACDFFSLVAPQTE